MDDLTKNIKRFRLIRGFDQDRMAGLLGISRVTYSKIENGRSKVTDDLFYRLSRVLEVSPEALINSPEAKSKPFFRHKKAMTQQQRACNEQMILDAERKLSDYAFLEEVTHEPICVHADLKALQHSVASLAEAKALGTRVRNLFSKQGYGHVDRFGEAIEANGIRFLDFTFPSNDEFGFTLQLKDGVTGIAVNTHPSISGERQLFTLCHEVGHFMMHSALWVAQDGESLSKEEAKRMEKEADAFASGLLMPDADFDAAWRGTEGQLWFNRVLAVKKLFSVSYQTVIYRLDEKYREANGEKTPPPYRFWFRQKFKLLFGRELPSREEACPGDIRMQSSRYLRLARRAFLSNEITMSRLAELLGKGALATRSLANEWAREEMGAPV